MSSGLPQHGALSPTALARVATAVAAEDAMPAVVGRYRVVRVIAEGGMGTVYEATQDHPRRSVALKLIRPHVMSPAVLRRFEYEADVLARLEHPGIARVYDAGLTETPLGRQPFFAMELIHGLPLDQWARAHRPPLKRRLEVLIAICQAVQHAHVKGVIHRDLKPANILVTDDGQPKVLDFGVARATDCDLQAATTLHTAPGALVGTLPYMAPEQAAGNAHELDAACDVYALGVIAYELLSGHMPYAVGGRPLHEAVAVICEREPARLSSFDAALRGDVETIVRKALQKDKTRRYATPADLAADIRRHLHYLPIAARPPSAWYQFSRFVRRVTVATWQAVRAERAQFDESLQRQAATEATAAATAFASFLEHTFAAVDPNRVGGEQTPLRDTLDEAVARIHQGELKGQPAVEAHVRASLGDAYSRLGLYPEAETHLRAAAQLYRRAPGTDRVTVAISLEKLGAFLRTVERIPAITDGIYDSNSARLVEAEKLCREALAIAAQSLAADDPVAVTVTASLAKVLRDRGQLDEAERLSRRVLAVRRKLPDANHPDLIVALYDLGGVLLHKEDVGGAETAYREALARAEAKYGPDHTEVARILVNLVKVAHSNSDAASAEPLSRRAVGIARTRLNPEHSIARMAFDDLVRILEKQGDEAGVRRECSIEADRFAPLIRSRPNDAELRVHRGEMYARAGRQDEASADFQAARALRASSASGTGATTRSGTSP